jgi:hypothetical protein
MFTFIGEHGCDINYLLRSHHHASTFDAVNLSF